MKRKQLLAFLCAGLMAVSGPGSHIVHVMASDYDDPSDMTDEELEAWVDGYDDYDEYEGDQLSDEDAGAWVDGDDTDQATDEDLEAWLNGDDIGYGDDSDYDDYDDDSDYDYNYDSDYDDNSDYSGGSDDSGYDDDSDYSDSDYSDSDYSDSDGGSTGDDSDNGSSGDRESSDGDLESGDEEDDTVKVYNLPEDSGKITGAVFVLQDEIEADSAKNKASGAAAVVTSSSSEETAEAGSDEGKTTAEEEKPAEEEEAKEPEVTANPVIRTADSYEHSEIESVLDLKQNENQEWTYSSASDAWTLSVVSAVANPELPDEEGVSVCVPGAYVTGVDTNGDGKADVTAAKAGSAVKGSLVIDRSAHVTSTNGQYYTADTAPVIINTGAAGYSEQQNQLAQATYAGEGYINVACGNRGKQSMARDEDGDLYYTGDAPCCLVDQKSAIRFVKYNILLGNLPGSVNYFVSTGGSGGGAHAAMVAATSDNPDFYDYEIDVGAVGIYKNEDGTYTTTVRIGNDEYSISDGVWGCVAYSPITSLSEADMSLAFEYYLDQDYDFNTPFQKQLAAILSDSYMNYINNLNLKIEEPKVGFDLNGNGITTDTVDLKIEKDAVKYADTNGYGGTYLTLYLEEFISGLQRYLDNLDYASDWTWFNEEGEALTDAAVSALTTEEKATAFIEGRYAKGSSEMRGPGMGGNGPGMPGEGMGTAQGQGEMPTADTTLPVNNLILSMDGSVASASFGAAPEGGEINLLAEAQEETASAAAGTAKENPAADAAGIMTDTASATTVAAAVQADETMSGEINLIGEAAGAAGTGDGTAAAGTGNGAAATGTAGTGDGAQAGSGDAGAAIAMQPDGMNELVGQAGTDSAAQLPSAGSGPENRLVGNPVVGTPAAGTTQSAGSSVDSANYASYEDMVAEYKADITEIKAGDTHDKNIVSLYNPMLYIGDGGTDDPAWTRIVMGASEGDMSLFASMNLMIRWLNAGTDATVEWQWDGGHVPSEILGDSFALCVDEMYGKHVPGAIAVTKKPAEALTANGTAESPTGTDIRSWIDYGNPSNVSFTLADAVSYRTGGANKAVPGFDVIDYGQEDYEFGSYGKDARHWDEAVYEALSEHADVLKPLFNS